MGRPPSRTVADCRVQEVGAPLASPAKSPGRRPGSPSLPGRRSSAVAGFRVGSGGGAGEEHPTRRARVLVEDRPISNSGGRGGLPQVVRITVSGQATPGRAQTFWSSLRVGEQRPAGTGPRRARRVVITSSRPARQGRPASPVGTCGVGGLRAPRGGSRGQAVHPWWRRLHRSGTRGHSLRQVGTST